MTTSIGPVQYGAAAFKSAGAPAARAQAVPQFSGAPAAPGKDPKNSANFCHIPLITPLISGIMGIAHALVITPISWVLSHGMSLIRHVI
jgi:hypothetical protein